MSQLKIPKNLNFLLQEKISNPNNKLNLEKINTQIQHLTSSSFFWPIFTTLALMVLIIILRKKHTKNLILTLKLKMIARKLSAFLNMSEITYSDIISYVLKNKNEVEKLSKLNKGLLNKGVLILEKNSDSYCIIQVFIDNNNRVICYPDGKPFGRRLKARKIDDELLEYFNNEILVFIE